MRAVLKYLRVFSARTWLAPTRLVVPHAYFSVAIAIDWYNDFPIPRDSIFRARQICLAHQG